MGSHTETISKNFFFLKKKSHVKVHSNSLALGAIEPHAEEGSFGRWWKKHKIWQLISGKCKLIGLAF